MTKRLFRQNHPVLFGLLILGGIFAFFWFGITFFIASIVNSYKGDIFRSDSGIGVIHLEGMIISPEEVIENLTDFREDNKIYAVLIRIDSPGGAVGASQEIFQEIQQTAKVKPVVASMGSIAASGGYYAALGADKIIANPGTLTGSIGVIMKFANLEKVFDRVGYKSEVIKSGEHKDIGSMSRAISQEERKILQDLIDNVHEQFVDAVADARKIPTETVKALANGRIFTGKQAKDLGLIDELGNFTVAIELAAKLAGITDKKPSLVYPAENGFSILKFIAG